jgi:hypothetical protein
MAVIKSLQMGFVDPYGADFNPTAHFDLIENQQATPKK